MLAVAYPIWKADILPIEQTFGEQTEYDRFLGIDNTLGFLFFPKSSSSIALYQLIDLYPEWEEKGMINRVALLNAICKYYPEYVKQHNEKNRRFNSCLIEATIEAGTQYLNFWR